MKVGDFLVLTGHKEAAEETHAERSEEAKRVETSRRAPITTSYQAWKSNPDHYDFPGVDTPSEEPNVLPKDLTHEEPAKTSHEVRGEAPHPPLTEEDMDANERVLSEMGVPASPEEVFEGMYVRSTGDGMGGPMYNRDLGRPVETDRAEEEQRPPESALKRQSRDVTGEQHERSEAIMFIYEEEAPDDVSLSSFKRRVKRKKREMSGLADDWAAARLVVDDLRG